VEGIYHEHHESFTKAMTPVLEGVLCFAPRELEVLRSNARAFAAELVAVELTATRAALDVAGFAGAERCSRDGKPSRHDLRESRRGLSSNN
jgi:hypothetical protein